MSQWHYFNLELILDPIFLQSNPGYKPTLDPLAWKSILVASLGKLHGIIGEATHVDVLDISKTNPSKCLVRIQNEDKEKFINSLFAFTFKLNKYAGGEDVACTVRIIKEAEFIGLVIDEGFK